MTKKRPAKPAPEMGAFLDDEERAIHEAIESVDYQPRSILTSKNMPVRLSGEFL